MLKILYLSVIEGEFIQKTIRSYQGTSSNTILIDLFLLTFFFLILPNERAQIQFTDFHVRII